MIKDHSKFSTSRFSAFDPVIPSKLVNWKLPSYESLRFETLLPTNPAKVVSCKRNVLLSKASITAVLWLNLINFPGKADALFCW